MAFGVCVTGCASLPSPAPGQYTDPIGLFEMGAYDQDVDHWIVPHRPDYDQPFLSGEDQRAHYQAFYARYFGTGAKDPSPWNSSYIEASVYRDGGRDIAAWQRRHIARFDNRGKASHLPGYGQDLRPHTGAWIDAIALNMDTGQFEHDPGYDPARRAIATDNLLVRELPTMDPSFYDRRLAGEGYPFDNLQVSAVRPGTPLYVLGTSRDGGWCYVQTPDLQGWVRSEGVGKVDDAFVEAWTRAASDALGVVTTASAPIRDRLGTFRFDAPAGSLLPLLPMTKAGRYPLLVPARDAAGQAVIRTAELSDAQIAPLPLSATPRHLAMLLKNLIGRPYGWGDTGLYNDCSSELQTIFAAFGVWLPRSSWRQMSAGQMTDLSDATPAARLDYLVHHGQPMRTLIYIGGHVMLYLGNTMREGRLVPVVYQNIWGLRPAANDRRAVIGGSVILPLLEHIPEDTALQSLAARPIFQIAVIGAPKENLPAQAYQSPPAD